MNAVGDVLAAVERLRTPLARAMVESTHRVDHHAWRRAADGGRDEAVLCAYGSALNLLISGRRDVKHAAFRGARRMAGEGAALEQRLVRWRAGRFFAALGLHWPHVVQGTDRHGSTPKHPRINWGKVHMRAPNWLAGVSALACSLTEDGSLRLGGCWTKDVEKRGLLGFDRHFTLAATGARWDEGLGCWFYDAAWLRRGTGDVPKLERGVIAEYCPNGGQDRSVRGVARAEVGEAGSDRAGSLDDMAARRAKRRYQKLRPIEPETYRQAALGGQSDPHEAWPPYFTLPGRSVTSPRTATPVQLARRTPPLTFDERSRSTHQNRLYPYERELLRDAVRALALQGASRRERVRPCPLDRVVDADSASKRRAAA